MSLDNTSNATRKFAYEYLSALNCPRALTVWLLFSSGEHDQLTQLDFQPELYPDWDKTLVGNSYAATKVLSKYPELKTTFSRSEVAMETFFASEVQCRLTNQRLRDWENEPHFASSIILMAVRKIDRILGSFDYDEFVDSCNWGPGASTAVKRRDASGPNKFRIESGITAQAYDFISPFWADMSRRFSPRPFCFEVANKIVTVPKNAKTDRVIAIEPGLNLWFQKGIGSMLRRRLRRTGIDLNKGQDHHDRLAKLASKTGHLATVDFSAASDTISYELVKQLLPTRWFVLLEAFRSSRGSVGKEIYHYEKFSSMGNGYTFELESLIFYALAWASAQSLNVEGEISVYGDDVILPTGVFTLYSDVCEYCGFRVNKSKSYWTGWFRESCGAHYFRGKCIKPIFLKEIPDGTQALFKLANSVRRFAHRRNSYGCDRTLRRCWLTLVGMVTRSHKRLTISDGFGDGGLVVNLDEISSSVSRPPHFIEGFFARSLVDLAIKREEDHEGLLSFKLKSMGDLATGNLVAYPNRTRSRIIKLLIPRWVDLGPWI